MSLKLPTQSDQSPLRRNEPSLEDFCHNELFDILGNKRRRYVLWCLYHGHCPVKSGELARQIAAWEHSSDREEVPSSLYQSVYNALNQTHLPKLESVGFVEFDKQRNLIYPTVRMAEVELFINSVAPRTNDRQMRRLRTLASGLLVSVISGSFYLYLSTEPELTPLVMLVLFGAFVIGGLIG